MQLQCPSTFIVWKTAALTFVLLFPIEKDSHAGLERVEGEKPYMDNTPINNTEGIETVQTHSDSAGNIKARRRPRVLHRRGRAAFVLFV